MTAIDSLKHLLYMAESETNPEETLISLNVPVDIVREIISAEPQERKTGLFTGEEIKAIRIHMNAFKEQLCNQHRWKEAEEYQQIVDKLDDMMEVENE